MSVAALLLLPSYCFVNSCQRPKRAVCNRCHNWDKLESALSKAESLWSRGTPPATASTRCLTFDRPRRLHQPPPHPTYSRHAAQWISIDNVGPSSLQRRLIACYADDRVSTGSKWRTVPSQHLTSHICAISSWLLACSRRRRREEAAKV